MCRNIKTLFNFDRAVDETTAGVNLERAIS